MKLKHTMIKMKQWGFIAATAFALASCGGSTNESSSTNDLQEDVNDSKATVETVKTFYQIPSPGEMFSFINVSDFNYSTSNLHDANKVNNYTSPNQQALNFGFYASDLAFSSIFEKYQESVKYFAAIQKLSDELGISYAFNEELVERIQNNMENADSLLIITNDSYVSVIESLEKNDQGKVLALLACGGWIESMHIVLENAGDVDSKLSKKIADQRYTLENLILYLGNYKDDAAVADLIGSLTPIMDIYTAEKAANTTTTLQRNESSKMVLGGSSAKISAESIAKIKEVIASIRETYIV